jgi:histidine triad (HIT) family protein
MTITPEPVDVDCDFCRIVHRQLAAAEVYRDDHVTAFLDHHPVTAGHVLIVPNGHFASLAELPQAIGAHFFAIGQRLAAALRSSGLPCEGINLFLADGEAAFQEVFHAHLHVIPRTARDGFTIDSPAWRQPPPAAHELDVNALAIKTALTRMDDGRSTT